MNKRQRKKQLQKLQPIDLTKVSTEDLWEELAARLVTVSMDSSSFFVNRAKNWPHMTLYNIDGFSLITKREFRED